MVLTRPFNETYSTLSSYSTTVVPFAKFLFTHYSGQYPKGVGTYPLGTLNCDVKFLIDFLYNSIEVIDKVIANTTSK